MKLLIDSSTNYLFLALTDNNNFYSFVREGKNDHSETLMDSLDKFLQDKKISYNDIDHVLIGRGPGSYTGLRIAGTIGKVLAYTSNKKFSSFSSLDLAICNVLTSDGKYLSRIDARKGAYFLKAVSINNKAITEDIPECFKTAEEMNGLEEYKIVEINQSVFDNAEQVVNNLLDNKLYQDEDYFEYSPNYLRNVI